MCADCSFPKSVARGSDAFRGEESGVEPNETTESAASTSDYASCCDDLASPADDADMLSDRAAALPACSQQGTASASAGPQEPIRFPAIQLRLLSPLSSDMVAEREVAVSASGEYTPQHIPFYVVSAEL